MREVASLCGGTRGYNLPEIASSTFRLMILRPGLRSLRGERLKFASLSTGRATPIQKRMMRVGRHQRQTDVGLAVLVLAGELHIEGVEGR